MRAFYWLAYLLAYFCTYWHEKKLSIKRYHTFRLDIFIIVISIYTHIYLTHGQRHQKPTAYETIQTSHWVIELKNDYSYYILREQSSVPDDLRRFLMTSCPGSSCLGSLFPRVRNATPSSELIARILSVLSCSRVLSCVLSNIGTWWYVQYYMMN